MNIQFGSDAAQKACDSLSEQSLNIAKNTDTLFELVDSMKTVWEGDLANKMIAGLMAHKEYLIQVRGYVNYLDRHIAICEYNYHLTETTAKARTEGSVNMFL